MTFRLFNDTFLSFCLHCIYCTRVQYLYCTSSTRNAVVNRILTDTESHMTRYPVQREIWCQQLKQINDFLIIIIFCSSRRLQSELYVVFMEYSSTVLYRVSCTTYYYNYRTVLLVTRIAEYCRNILICSINICVDVLRCSPR
jgi:hypothetical protein